MVNRRTTAQYLSICELAQSLGSSTKLPLIFIDIKQQCLQLLSPLGEIAAYSVSTSRFGTGCEQNSYKTPLGLHSIAEKLGAGAESGEVFQSRVSNGTIASINHSTIPSDKDLICSRILWLRGLVPGLNAEKNCDSYARYIYIHGTSEEGMIGKPASIGCIRLRNQDVINLFNQVNVNTLVYIE